MRYLLTSNKRIWIYYLFYPCVMYLLTVRITEVFGLPKPSLFSNYKVMLLLCPLRVNWIQNVTVSKSYGVLSKSYDTNNNILEGWYFGTKCYLARETYSAPAKAYARWACSTCSAFSKVYAEELCIKHYLSVHSKFINSCDHSLNCWKWKGNCNPTGLNLFTIICIASSWKI